VKIRPSNRAAFTLIELLVVIVIISILATLLTPGIQKAVEKARSIACAANLRAIGASVQAYLADNDNIFPEIEPYPSNPVYTGDKKVGGMLDILGPYGVVDKTLQCPADLHGADNFAKEKSSYMWNPIADGENQNAVTIYGRRVHLLKKLTRLSLCSDFTSESGVGPHSGKVNVLYADGHVKVR
jgi:prepilin-type processing-associated H-X9-DG protein/prepilin-type N-terminal cleavage/methylation domain-containing protein